MKLQIRSIGIAADDSIREHVGRCMRLRLGHFNGVSRAKVLLVDVNGPRGGSDKSCRIEIKLPSSVVFVEGTGTDLFAAIDRVTGRAAFAVERELGRARSRRRSRPDTRATTVPTEEQVGPTESEWLTVECTDNGRIAR